ncbi:MAG: NAD(P)H-dependent oxidoreductase [Propionibacteriaceae bacterium]|jgi:FMN reductase|nr:NAD(P)H-dependent oxidoreductase [Propionibacteriaceae bacterium]
MTSQPFSLVVVSGGASHPSSTRMLADRIAERVVSRAGQRDRTVEVSVVELRPLAAEIATALTSQLLGPKLDAAVATLGSADGIIVSTPVYKAGPSGLLKGFLDVLDNDLLVAKPVVLAATAGTARHALVVDEQLRSLFAYLRTLTVPTSLFAASEDWGDATLTQRIDRAAVELVVLMDADFAGQVKAEAWAAYSHQYGSAGGTELGIDLDSDLMRLATGGSL